MRPPAIQAERCTPARRPPTGRPRFNEAACNTGGTLLSEGLEILIGHHASMRPPAIQAERAMQQSPTLDGSNRFNEAACNTGGTPPDSTRRESPSDKLQ